ncbi:hypothetical protein PHLGIDRAFT_122549 [Phlebiopsis gigantea 11061_1 CR5-6]|uniref:Uncharacterized protein n=1 Tax=Phlebiopsis gigantea (strain 11061_1 CR5-6) TaxID=745531 RepID=A0A0C3S3C1_PHLG1|nr:hypothetical protein PHLGIDRAFT_122549 [Phlebiopsis gigantea 11061_1 CR5-6]
MPHNREDKDLPSFGELRATEVEYNTYTTCTQKRNQFLKLADTWFAAFYAEDAMPPDAMLLMSRNMQHYHLRETKEEVLAEIIHLFLPRKAPYIPDIDFTPPDSMVGETQIALAKRKAINAAWRKAKNAWLKSDERKKLVKGYCDLLEQLTKISCLYLWPTQPEKLMTHAQLEELIETEGNQAEKDKARAKKEAKGKGKPGAKKDAEKKDGGGAAERGGEQGPLERMYYIPNTVEGPEDIHNKGNHWDTSNAHKRRGTFVAVELQF